MQPFRQGDLDGLCGVYSIINALKSLGYREDIEGWQAILIEIALQLQHFKKSTNFLINGITTPDISRVLKNIIVPKYEIAYSKPFHSKIEIPLSTLWDTLSLHLNSEKQRTAILCIQGHHYGHWTVISDLSEKRISFFDSTSLKWVNRSRCTTIDLTTEHSFLLYPTTLFLLERRYPQKD